MTDGISDGEQQGRKSLYLRFIVSTILIIILILLLTSFAACGRRGDPVEIIPYKEVGVVKDLNALIVDSNTYLTWGLPEGEDFPEKAIKGFVIFRAEVPEGVKLEECKCQYSPLEFIAVDSKGDRSLKRVTDKTFEYLDKKAIKGHAYTYKIVVMDKNKRMGNDSNTVLVRGVKPEEQVEKSIIPPKPPAGLLAVYTQKSIILTWKEVPGQEIKFYRIYRSESSKDFSAIGETVTPVFTDKNIVPSKKY